jgi:hypothetical protein
MSAALAFSLRPRTTLLSYRLLARGGPGPSVVARCYSDDKSSSEPADQEQPKDAPDAPSPESVPDSALVKAQAEAADLLVRFFSILCFSEGSPFMRVFRRAGSVTCRQTF